MCSEKTIRTVVCTILYAPETVGILLLLLDPLKLAEIAQVVETVGATGTTQILHTVVEVVEVEVMAVEMLINKSMLPRTCCCL